MNKKKKTRDFGRERTGNKIEQMHTDKRKTHR